MKVEDIDEKITESDYAEFCADGVKKDRLDFSNVLIEKFDNLLLKVLAKKMI